MKIAICGSMVFAKEMLTLKDQLTTVGHEVTLPADVESYVDNTKLVQTKWDKLENDVFKGYFEKIKQSDAILIVNIDKNQIKNYIGGNSLIEAAFAHILDKKIYLLNPIPEMSYTDEIEAMKPIVINGDIGLIEN